MPLVTVFRRLYDARFPIEEMRITTQAEQDAPPTGDGNDTGAFACRPVRGATSYSQHAYGLAVDVNPFQNPYLKGDLVLPELASSYRDRGPAPPGDDPRRRPRGARVREHRLDLGRHLALAEGPAALLGQRALTTSGALRPNGSKMARGPRAGRAPMADKQTRRATTHDLGASRPDRIRNVVLVGPSSSGKTTLVETLLASSGAIPRAGSVAEGTTVSDFEDAERSHQRSMSLAVTPLVHGGTKVNLVDTPGYADFVGELRAGLRAADCALFVVAANEGVDEATRQIWRECAAGARCRAPSW